MTVDRATIGNRLREARENAGMTQEALGRAIGLESATPDKQISHWETGRRVPNGRNLTRLADTLDVTTDWILGRE